MPAPVRHHRGGRCHIAVRRGRHRPRRPSLPEVVAIHQHDRHHGVPCRAGRVAIPARARCTAERHRHHQAHLVRFRGLLLGGDRPDQNGAELGDLPVAATHMQ